MNLTPAQMKKRIKELEAENKALKTHAPYGVLSRAGFEVEKRAVLDANYAVFADIDNMHGLNSRFGYENVNGMIRDALKLRTDDLLLSGLWFSGDELVFVIRSDPEGFIARVTESFAFYDIGITLAACPVENNDLNAAIDTAARTVQAAKAKKIGR